MVDKTGQGQRLITITFLVLTFVTGLCLRIIPPYTKLITDQWIKFSGTDAYYHMRLVDNLVHNFPHRIVFDPYTFYPQGTIVNWPPFFDWLIGGIAWLLGLGAPTQHLVDSVGVYMPAILGALVVFPVYFIGKIVFNRWVGIISAGLVSVMPGEFLGRSILGYTDHHVAEVLLSTATMLFLILGIKSAKQIGLSLNLSQALRVFTTKPFIYGLLSGLCLWIYLATWVGGLLFVFLIFVYFAVQFIVDHLKGEPTGYLAVVGIPLFAVAMFVYPSLPPAAPSPLCLPSLAIAIAGLLIMVGLSRLMSGQRVKAAYYPLSLLFLGLLGLAVLYIATPSSFKTALATFRTVFMPTGAALTILEVKPILFPQGSFSLSVVWGNFTTCFFLALISLGILVYTAIKRSEANKVALIVWSLVILAATLGQRRFAYYLSINIALLSAYVCWLVLEFAGFKSTTATADNVPGQPKKKAREKKRPKARSAGALMNMALGIIVVFLVVFFPNILFAKNAASAAAFAPSNAWLESLTWMKDNTPEPFNNPDFYYAQYDKDFHYPDSAYGIMVWWDYGHLVTRVAHRLPIANPFQQGATEAAQFFTAQDESTGNKLMSKLDAKYVIVDFATATTKFHGAAAFANIPVQNFYDVYYMRDKDSLRPVILYYPEYYRSLAVRLYNFDGSAVAAERPMVISYQEKTAPTGQKYKEITNVHSFSNYQEAEAFIASQKSGNYRIVSNHPFLSPVPLEKLASYKLVYSSKSNMIQAPDIGMISEVKIFEFIPPSP